MNIDFNSRAIIINGEDVAKDANLLVVDRFGNVKDITKDKNIAYPVAQIIPMQRREKDSTTITNIKNMLKAVELDDKAIQGEFGGKAFFYSDDKKEFKKVAEDGIGVVYYENGTYREQTYDASMGVESSNTTFGSTHIMKIYHGFLFGLNPYMAEVYIKTKKMAVNHCIIPSNGYKYPSICTEFFECVDYSKNSLHSSFVHKWKLEDSPVSFFDKFELIDIFERTNSYKGDMNNEPRENVKSLAEVFESDINLPLRRKLICWWYFLTKHTNLNRGVIVCFNRFLIQYFGESFYFLPHAPYETELLLKDIEGYIK